MALLGGMVCRSNAISTIFNVCNKGFIDQDMYTTQESISDTLDKGKSNTN